MSPGINNLGNGNQIRDGLEPCRPRYHAEGQTSSVGRRWQIWDGQRGLARFQNIADEGDAVLLCKELNAAQSSLDTMGGRIEELADERDALIDALTPSGETKAAYIGEFRFDIMVRALDPDEDELVPQTVAVPWTTIKEIMAAIRTHALRGEA